MQKQQNKKTYINDLKVYGHQVSGSAPKFIDKSQKYIYKSLAKTQGRFYEYIKNCHIGDKSYLISKYFPEYFGVFTQSEILKEQTNYKLNKDCSELKPSVLEPLQHPVDQGLSLLSTRSQRKQWIQHLNSRACYQKSQKFLKLGNLTFGLKYPNIMDIKLGIKHKQFRFKQFNSTTLTHGFRINGLSVRQFDQNPKEGTQRFLSKYYCQQVTQQHLNKHLAFFMSDGHKVHIKLLQSIIEELKILILGYVSFSGIRFKSSSLFIGYDAYDPKRFVVKFIDFENYQFRQGVDESILTGLNNCLRHFIQVVKQVDRLQEQLANKELMYFRQTHDIIPREKIQQYQEKKKLNAKHKHQRYN